MKIVIEIERLVLDGLPLTGSDAPRLRRALERELTRLVQGGGIAAELSGGGALASRNAPPIALAKSCRPDSVGRAVAGAVYGGIGTSVPKGGRQ